MHTVSEAAGFLGTSTVAGLLGGAAMLAVIRLITRSGWAKADMIVAVGSLFTRSHDRAFRTGIGIYIFSAIGFAIIYGMGLVKLGLAALPNSFFAGIGFGIFHGLIVSLMLVWVVAERHPLEEFQDAGFAVGVSHFAGHVAYGAVVGLVFGLCASVH
jgi:hypothetical protein